MILYQSGAQAHLISRCRSCPHDNSCHRTLPGMACTVAIHRFLEDLCVLSGRTLHREVQRTGVDGRDLASTYVLRPLMITLSQILG